MRHLARKLIAVTITVVGVNYTVARASRDRPLSAPVNAVDVHESLAAIDRQIDDLDRQIAAEPTSSSLDLVARLHLTRARISGDATSYATAQDAAARSLALAPRNVEARVLDAEIRYSNHDFAEARRRAEAIVAEHPEQLGALVIAADAARELGDDAGASRSLERARRARPDAAAVTVREARLAFLRGDMNLAVRLADRAEGQAASSGLLGSTLAFYPAFRAQLEHDRGEYGAALRHFRRALEIAPGDRVATLGLARSLAATGKVREAAAMTRALTETFPEPASLSLLGDLLGAAGDQAGARDAYELVEAVATLARANNQLYNRELALFFASRVPNHAEALRLARAEAAVRKDVYGYDVLAWAELRAGNLERADAAARIALAKGTPDARIAYHAGMIASARGERERAIGLLRRALELNPRFDVVDATAAGAELQRLTRSPR